MRYPHYTRNNKHTKDANEKHGNLVYCIPDINNEYQTKCNMNVNAHPSVRDIVYDKIYET